MSATEHILDVDLLAFEHGSPTRRRAVVDGVMRSLASGFVYTTHDLSEQLLDEAYDLLDRFFALPADAKGRWTVPGSHGQTGYTGLLVETAAAADVPDWKEMLNWGRPVPVGHPLRDRFPHQYHDPVLPEGDVAGITEVLMAFHDQMCSLQLRFLRIIAEGLGAHERFFDGLVAHGTTLTRAIRYPPMGECTPSGERSSGEATHVWAAEHADINLITALPRATARGLQIRTEDGWVDAGPPPGHVILNTGIMLERISNGLVPSGWHRVVADPDQEGGRLSVVQFCHPTPWTILTPLASTISAEHPQRFAGIQAGDLLAQVLYDINLIEDARRVG